MKASQRLAVCLSLAIAAGMPACNRAAAPQKTVEESYAAAAGAVGLEMIPLGNTDGAMRWLATYSDGTTTTKFEVEFKQAASASNNLLASGKGQFLSVADSNPTALLDALKEALQARHRPTHAQKIDALPFEYALLGDKQSRSPDGGFRSNPQGNWTTTKIFLADDQAEVYFNFNPVIHKGEFAIKDPDYGDRLLTEFAKVF